MITVTTWAGWKVEDARTLRSPKTIVLGPSEGAMLNALVAAGGTVMSKGKLAAAIAPVSRSKDPEGMIPILIRNLNRRLSGHGRIANVRRFGYRAIPVFGYETPEEIAAKASVETDPVAARMARVEAILVDQLEATGPHARAISKMIEEVYS